MMHSLVFRQILGKPAHIKRPPYLSSSSSPGTATASHAAVHVEVGAGAVVAVEGTAWDGMRLTEKPEEDFRHLQYGAAA
jgi:hypothetical protein